MKRALERATKFFDIPLDVRSRIVIFLAAVLILPALFTPLWQVSFQSSRYPDGLKLNVYSHKLQGGTESDLLEINALNYYMGIRSLEEEKFPEFRWLPFVLGAVILLALRAVVLGKMSKLVDLFVLITYAGVFGLWSFVHTLYAYGHDISNSAPVKIEPFTPPLFGDITVGNVDVSSSPGLGAYCMVLIPLVLLAAVYLSYRAWAADQRPKQDYLG
jgi:hypothetical protein